MKTNAVASVACLVLLGLAAGCARSDRDAAAAKPQQGHYALTGEVLSVDATAHTVRVQHDEVKGFMPAMTMDFAVSAGDAAVLKPNQRIRAELVTGDGGEFRLEKIWPDDKPAADTINAAARKLREDTLTQGNKAYHGDPGDEVPQFALFDQEGRVVPSTRFRGRQIMINFIFTRCPVATMCPASTAKMMMTQKLARDAGVANIEFVSITLDPAYDTPGVLKDYATTRGIDTSNFSFLTGPENAIKDLLTQFGVIAEFEGGLLKHSLATLLIDENGRIVHRADGSLWEPKDFVAKMRKT
jgi:protein SCO1/2